MAPSDTTTPVTIMSTIGDWALEPTFLLPVTTVVFCLKSPSTLRQHMWDKYK